MDIRIAERELQEKYNLEVRGDTVSLYYFKYRGEPVYRCHEDKITYFERGDELSVGNCGSLDKNLTAVTLKCGSGYEKVREKLRKVNIALNEARRKGTVEATVKVLGLDRFIENYLASETDIIIEDKDAVILLILKKDDCKAVMEVVSKHAQLYYDSLYKLILTKQYVEQFLKDNQTEAAPDDFLNYVGFCVSGWVPKIIKE